MDIFHQMMTREDCLIACKMTQLSNTSSSASGQFLFRCGILWGKMLHRFEIGWYATFWPTLPHAEIGKFERQVI